MTLDVESADEGTTSEEISSSDQGGTISVDSKAELSSSDEESKSASEKKAGMRKPSKKALENAMNKVSMPGISDTCSNREAYQTAAALFPHRQTATQEHIQRAKGWCDSHGQGED